MIKKLGSGITINMIQSPKFKDICFSINFFNENNAKNATERALLSMMLSDRCALYDTKKKMSEICDKLYGCTLGSRVLTYGKAHCLEIRSKIINPVFIHESNNLFNDWLSLIQEVIFSPFMIHGEFSLDLFEENKRILNSKILRREDDAQSYTVGKVFSIAGENQPLSVKPRGNLEVLEHLSVSDITRQYLSMMENDQIEIVICGDFDENQLLKLIMNKLCFSERKGNFENYYCLDTTFKGEKREEKDQPQSNIAMLLQTNVKVTDRDYPALKVANGILGQLPSSYLFQVVREQHSLCYSIYSSLISYDGACLITTGVEKKNVDQAIILINEQIKRCQDGDISEELLSTTKQMLINALNNSCDDMSSIMAYNLGNSILKRDYTISQNIEDVSRVTIEDCISVFKKMKMIATFVLESKENENE